MKSKKAFVLSFESLLSLLVLLLLVGGVALLQNAREMKHKNLYEYLVLEDFAEVANKNGMFGQENFEDLASAAEELDFCLEFENETVGCEVGVAGAATSRIVIGGTGYRRIVVRGRFEDWGG